MDLPEQIKKVELSVRTIATDTIIIATGASPGWLDIPGEDTFYGKGLSARATCDGPFYKERIVAAVGGGDTLLRQITTAVGDAAIAATSTEHYIETLNDGINVW